MADNPGEDSQRPKREMNTVEGIMGPPPPPKRRHTRAVKPKIVLGEDKSRLETIIKAKGEGAAVSQACNKQSMEKSQGPPEVTLKKSIPSASKEMAGATVLPSTLGSVGDDSPGSSGDWQLLKPSGNTDGEVKRIEFFTGEQTFLQLLHEVEYMKGRVKFAEHTISEAMKELVDYDASKTSTRPDPVSVVMDFPPPHKHQLAGEGGGSSIETTTDGKGKGGNGGQDDHEKPMEKDADI